MQIEAKRQGLPDVLPNTPENRKITAQRVIKFLKKSGIWDISRDPASRNAFIQCLDLQTAEDFLERLNGIIVGTPIHQREIYEHAQHITHKETGEIEHSPADAEFQKKILERIILPTIKSAKPTVASEFATASINMLHSFRDGNGRLARTVYFLTNPKLSRLSEAKAEKYLEEALGPSKLGINFNPGYIRGSLDKMVLLLSDCKDERIFDVTGIDNFSRIQSESDSLDQNKGTGEAQRANIAREITEDSFISFLGSREYIFAKPKEEIERYLIPVPGTDKFHIDGNALMDDMSQHDNVDKWWVYLNIPKMQRFLALREVFIDAKYYPSIEQGLNLKQFFEREAFEDYAEKVVQNNPPTTTPN